MYKLEITSLEEKYKYIDSYWDIKSECNYKVINIINSNEKEFKIVYKNSEMNLNTLIKKKLNSFIEKQIKSKTNLPEIQCSEFCNLINWVENFNQYTKEEINLNNLNELIPWENIVICKIWNDESNFRINNSMYIKKPYFHFATYLWNWLYISKFGKWNIYITSFKEMKNIYNYPSILKIKKKIIK